MLRVPALPLKRRVILLHGSFVRCTVCGEVHAGGRVCLQGAVGVMRVVIHTRTHFKGCAVFTLTTQFWCFREVSRSFRICPGLPKSYFSRINSQCFVSGIPSPTPTDLILYRNNKYPHTTLPSALVQLTPGPVLCATPFRPFLPQLCVVRNTPTYSICRNIKC
jgi:hypothetical protein